jgi:ribosomal protein S18 acetylase RimI-like enzyme
MSITALRIRAATRKDLLAIVRLLADDVLGATRERVEEPLSPGYLSAFEAIAADPNQELVVGCLGDEVVGCLQLTFTPGLSHGGAWRATVEGVRIASTHRSQGLGEALMHWVVERARERGCSTLQLTTDKRRRDAHRFYERLGFVASHEGMKLALER